MQFRQELREITGAYRNKGGTAYGVTIYKVDGKQVPEADYQSQLRREALWTSERTVKHPLHTTDGKVFLGLDRFVATDTTVRKRFCVADLVQ